MSTLRQTLCPSAQPDWQGSQLIGVVGGTAQTPEVAYLPEPQPITEELLALAQPVKPTEVFRFAAPCACSGCGHYAAEQAKCKLAEKVVRWAPVVVDKLPACSIRASCRWWQQEGKAACMRCPQVVTESFKSSEAIINAANPAVL
jgi:hypothetical protein